MEKGEGFVILHLGLIHAFHGVLMMPNSKNNHKWPKVKVDPMSNGYLINKLNYDPKIVKIWEGLCTPKSPFLE